MTDNRYTSLMTPGFWDTVREGLREVFAEERTIGEPLSDMEFLLSALNCALAYLSDGEEECNDPDKIVAGHFGDADMTILKSRVSPEGYQILLKNSYWHICQGKQSGEYCFFNLTEGGEENVWNGVFWRPVKGTIDILKAVDSIIPAIMEMIPGEKMLYSQEMAIRDIEDTTESATSLSFNERRPVEIDHVIYLVDDINRDAWLFESKNYRINTDMVLTLPERVEIDGQQYPVTSVEIGAFFNDVFLKELYIPDSYKYLDPDCFHDCDFLTKVHIGKGLKKLYNGTFAGCNISRFFVDSENPYIRASADGKSVEMKF